MVQKAGKKVIASPFLNVFNSFSLDECERMGIEEITVSNELNLKQISRLEGDIKRGVAVYGYLPLMLTRNCPIKNGRKCNECNKQGFLTDRKGIRFPVRCVNGCSYILNSVPLNMSEKTDDIKNVDFHLYFFTVENKNGVLKILDDYKNKRNPSGEFTRGLLYKGVE